MDNWFSRLRVPVVLAVLLVLSALGGKLGPKSADAQPPGGIVISTQVPADPQGGVNASPSQLANFAWNQFIALTWAAVPQTGAMNTRGVANPAAIYGDPSAQGPLAWETFRGKVEIFPGAGLPNGYVNNPSQDYGFDGAPQYNYASAIPPCSGSAPATVAWPNLDETSQIGQDLMYAAAAPSAGPAFPNQNQQFLFLAKGNRTQYVYVAQNGYYDGGTAGTASAAAIANAAANLSIANPANYKTPYINFPTGTIEAKAAYRLLGPNDDASRFHTAPVRYYTQIAKNQFCYNQATFGLVSLHLIHKTPSFPTFVYTTFEQVDTIKLPNGQNAELNDGTETAAAQALNPTTPPITVTAATPTAHQIVTAGSGTCSPGNALLYYQNTQGNPVPQQPICVNKRQFSIPPPVIAANQQAQAMIASYSQQKLGNPAKAVWQYYKLVNTQAQLVDKSQVTPTNAASFNLANIVVETNSILQEFSGEFDPCNGANGLETDYAFVTDGSGNCSLSTPAPPFFNVYDNVNNNVVKVNMGGCKGCHGNAQVFGADFSFILLGGRVKEPDGLPAAASPTAAVRSTNTADLAAKYRRLVTKGQPLNN